MKIVEWVRKAWKSLVTFLRETRAELRKVIWPSWSDVRTYTLVVIFSMVSIGAILWCTDFLTALLVGWVTKH